MKTSACGLICEECPYYKKECGGCYFTQGKPFWAAEATPNGVCPIFDCSVNKKKFKNCGDCSELPCKIFTGLKDPNISEVEHHISIQKRVALLRGEIL